MARRNGAEERSPVPMEEVRANAVKMRKELRAMTPQLEASFLWESRLKEHPTGGRGAHDRAAGDGLVRIGPVSPSSELLPSAARRQKEAH